MGSCVSARAFGSESVVAPDESKVDEEEEGELSRRTFAVSHVSVIDYTGDTSSDSEVERDSDVESVIVIENENDAVTEDTDASAGAGAREGEAEEFHSEWPSERGSEWEDEWAAMTNGRMSVIAFD